MPNGQSSPNVGQIADLLADYDSIEFALLFGSFADGNPQPWSDMDIAVYLSRSLGLLEQGQLTATLERHLNRDVDLLVLNTALDHNPALAYRAITEGMLLFCRDRETFVDCKTRAMLRYLDTTFLRALVSHAFHQRLKTGRFGTGG
ncbi:nucleotidyltransferase domain-containing protein [Chloroflexus sp. Y-396-1]|uniref:type VII toxin-antitoxin system MntA family adenylyltransferase antitoxin n=1 Tax=Chloroflexus sp. Y-396-1 TaxID=867845 RepID=UPI00049145DD|nr:nucleotidyltransferase domain-containing protein [Chloroflexus sp. Y-396-1]